MLRNTLTRYAWALVCGWTVIVGLSATWNVSRALENSRALAIGETRVHLEQERAFNLWSVGLGGVYAPVSTAGPPNELLAFIPDRDIETPTGRELTLLSPHSLLPRTDATHANGEGIRHYLTSLKPKDPSKSPDAWEREALLAFERGKTEHSEFVEIDGEPVLRMMRPLITEQRCLRCHGQQGYKVGDIRGGLEALTPLKPFRAVAQRDIATICLTHALLWLLVLLGIGRGTRRLAGSISERDQAERALEESREELSTVLDNSPDTIWLVDKAGRVLFANRPPAEWDRSAVTGRPILEFVRPDHHAIYRRSLREVFQSGQSVSRELLDARGRWLTQRFVPLEYSGRVVSAMVIATDITERREVEEERRRLAAQMHEARKLESLGALAGGTAHHFNNMLTSILGNASMALDRMAPASPARDLIARAERTARRAADLTSQIMAYTGAGHFTVEPTDLNQVVSDLTDLPEVVMERKAILEYHLAEGLPPIDADEPQISQLISNLVANAAEALAGDGGVISVSTGVRDCDRAYLADVVLGEQLSEQEYVFLEVSDAGQGIDADALHKIFDPFFSTKSFGRGLGLAAVLGIVRRHDGAIKIESERGRGTSIRVLFPIARQPEKHVVGQRSPVT